ncbi:MAG: hypothetical protein K6E59_00645 [Bacilli bacterium]|nr:hypothetical protein [Bacilli bacterium]
MLSIDHGVLRAYLKTDFGSMMRYVSTHPELKHYVRFVQVATHRHISIDRAPVKSTLFIHLEREDFTIEEFDAFYKTAMVDDAKCVVDPTRTRRSFSDCFLVRFEDGHGNRDPLGKVPDGLVSYLKGKGFKCKSGCGYWGCPWYYVDITRRIFYPGRPGVCYAEVIGDRSISFEEFKEILSIYERYDPDDPILATRKKEPIQAIIETSSYEKRMVLAGFIEGRFPSTKTTFFETEGHHKGACRVVFEEGRAFGIVGAAVSKDLLRWGYRRFGSVEAFVNALSQ